MTKLTKKMQEVQNKLIKADAAHWFDDIKYIADNKKTLQIIQLGVSSSGMSRRLKVFYIKNNQMINITRGVALVLGWTYNRDGELIVKGCGMDMHFHTSYCFFSALFDYKKALNLGNRCYKSIY